MFPGSIRTFDGMNEGHQRRDRQVRSRVDTPQAPTAPAALATPIAESSVPTVPQPQGPTQSGQDVYRNLIRQMANAEPQAKRESSPHGGDRRLLAGQRAEQNAAMAPGGDAREIAMSRRGKTLSLHRPNRLTIEASSSIGKPPGAPGTGADTKGAQRFNIAKKPRPATSRRPLLPQDTITGKKGTAEDDGGMRGRPPQPRPSMTRGPSGLDLHSTAQEDLLNLQVRPLKTFNFHPRPRRLTHLR